METFWVKSDKPRNKNAFFKSLHEHDKNRTKLVGRGPSEIALFVAGKEHKGYVTQLWHGFLKNCKDSGVTAIQVETNKQSAASFYQQLGFKHLSDFDSLLHAYATPDGQACLYRYTVI